ncbi:MAG: metal-dependent hydrolase [Thermocladium sp.]
MSGSYLRWLGHAAFELRAGGKTILIDPWISNPMSPVSINDLKQVDFILVTHDHSDHLGETVEIAKRTGATVVGVFELMVHLEEKERLQNTIGMNMSGTVKLSDGIEAIMVPATHSSTHGSPAGFIVKAPEATIYHAGDTGLFSDMELIGRLYKPDVALLPIGSTFTMGPREAAYAVSLLNPRIAIPMHFNTFPPIKQNPEDFTALVSKLSPHVKTIVMKPGDKLQLPP